MTKHKERQFQIEIVQHLTSSNYVEGDASGYDRELSLYPDDLITYIKTTQPQAYEKMQKREGSKTDAVLVKHVAKEMDKQGSLFYLRNELKYIGSKFKLCQFKPELHNPDTQTKYDANILRVVQEVTTKSGNERIDLVSKNINLSTISELLGHADITLTARTYAKSDEASKIRAVC